MHRHDTKSSPRYLDRSRVFSAHALGQGNIDQLYSAAEKGDIKSIQAAIAAGVDVNAADPAGCTALMKAASGGKLEAVRALLKAGAKVNARSKQGFTPLMASVASGNVTIAKLLLDSGADVSAATPNGLTALEWDALSAWLGGDFTDQV